MQSAVRAWAFQRSFRLPYYTYLSVCSSVCQNSQTLRYVLLGVTINMV